MKTPSIHLKNRYQLPMEEAYNVLRGNIQFCSYDKKIKTITLTSCKTGEGKTTTAINLAMSMAKADTRVLLIDADLRKPIVVKHLGEINTDGLSSLISGNATLEEVIVKGEIPNFSYIPCGPIPPNPSELVSSGRFTQILRTVEEQFDLVIIDTPPLGSFIDGAVISAQTDGTVLVVESRGIDFQSVEKIKAQLEKANARILGVVLNKIKNEDHKNLYNYYGYYSHNNKSRKCGLKQTENGRPMEV